MSKFPITFNAFQGGWAGDIKNGAPGTFAYSRGIDFRKAPSQMSVLPALVKESGSVFTATPVDMIQLPSGKMVAIDNAGGVYVRTTGGSWSKNGTTLTSTAYGMVYNQQKDIIYVPGLNNVHTITNADGRFSGGTFTVNESAISQTQDQGSTAGHANTYTTLGAIAETAGNYTSFTPTVEPCYSIKIWITTKGTGSVTVTLHDAANNNLGEVTLAAAALTNGAYAEFIFTTPARMMAKPNAATYHFHVTHSGGTASTIGSSVAATAANLDYLEYANRLVNPVNGFHPVIEFLQYILIGNERYVATWEPIAVAPTNLEFLQHRLTFPVGYQVTSMALWSQYVAIACEKRSTSSTNEFQDGKIFLWDGISSTYNLIINVPEGAPYAIHAHHNRLYWFADGGWWAWAGGNPAKVFQMPNTDFEYTSASTYLINYPHTMAVRKGILLAGFPSETNSTNIEHGVYSFGARDKNYPESFGFSYPISTGTLTNGTLRIGMVKNFGDKLFVGWRDGSDYGVDKVDPNSTAQTSASFETLVTDSLFINKGRSSRPDKQKQATKLSIVFKTLPAGATVTPKYKLDRESSWQLGTAVSSASADPTIAGVNINKRYKEAQVGFDLVTTGTTPEILGLVLITDTLTSESD